MSTWAGTGTASFTDGTGNTAAFNTPYGIAVDRSGQVYVADQNNHRIRKITPAGEVSTLAGTGSAGSADGTGATATFDSPHGVAVDQSGNVYVADSYNHSIRIISTEGLVSTLAGVGGAFGTLNGTGGTAKFFYPYGVAVDTSGTVYVAEYGNHLIRQISPSGVVTNLAGVGGTGGAVNGTGGTARFNNPSGIALDTSGNVYVADIGNHLIRKISAAGVVSSFAGIWGAVGHVNGTAGTARFDNPSGVAIDTSGHVYVADTYSHLIRKISPEGVVSTLAGTTGVSGVVEGSGQTARFFYPKGVAVDTSGTLYVADANNHLIRKITPAGVVTTLAGVASTSGSSDGMGTTARFNFPSSVAVDQSGTVYVADANNHLIRKITPAGVVTTLAGVASTSGSSDGMGTAARFNIPYGVAVDPSGHVYVADQFNQRIRKISPAGVVRTVAGLGGSFSFADGTGTAAQFNNPTGVAVDASGNLYVSDQFNNRIRKITPI